MAGERPRLLLLNPPARGSVFRDCYCSGLFKGALRIAPLDLQVQSGFFSGREFQVHYLDAVYERRPAAETLEAVRRLRPDIILALIGDAFLEDDVLFLNGLSSSLPRARLFVSGDTARFHSDKVFECIPGCEGILLDFTSSGLRDYLEGRPFDSLRLRAGDREEDRSLSTEPFRCPLPDEGVIKKYTYRLPFFRSTVYYSILSSFGCPYTCRYCNAHLVGYRHRAVDDFLKELAYAASLGFRSVYIRDPTFMVDRARALEIFEAWKKRALDLEWMCFTRAELLDAELAQAAADRGCRLMMLGVESFDEGCLERLNRHVGSETLRDSFRLLRAKGVRTSAHLMLGVHDGRAEHYEGALLAFLRELDPDYVSLNVFARRPGVTASDPVLTAIEGRRLHYEAMAGRIYRKFYLSPRSLRRQLSLVRGPEQILLLGRNALSMLFHGT